MNNSCKNIILFVGVQEENALGSHKVMLLLSTLVVILFVLRSQTLFVGFFLQLHTIKLFIYYICILFMIRK